MSPRTFDQSSKLKDVLYEIRGAALVEADRLQDEGHTILKLNTGNPAIFGFEAPFQIVRDMIEAVPQAHGYSDSRGIMSARRAIVSRYEEEPGFPKFDPDDVYLGNGVSELITMTMQALLDEGDEVLIPAPDYPLWTAMTSLAGGTPVHYRCDPDDEWQPDLDEGSTRRVVGDVLSFYATEPARDRLQSSVAAIKEALPLMQRLVLLNDLVYIAEADGDFTHHEKEMLAALSTAWDIPVRLNGKLV